MLIGKTPKKFSGNKFECGECGLLWPDEIKALECCGERIEDIQIGGDHYRTKAVQPWDAMEAWMTEEQFIGFLRGNAIKYLARAGSKGDPMIDYRKAQHYMAKLIEVLDGE